MLSPLASYSSTGVPPGTIWSMSRLFHDDAKKLTYWFCVSPMFRWMYTVLLTTLDISL